ncbi:MAG TPA: hypothetical protein VLA89_01995, partial [Gemmatimonadales bacterium]|nr:hypothetical protein [Gemmatimonadales bacterium]
MAEKTVRITLKADLVRAETDKEAPKAVAYAFSSGGRLLAREQLNKSGEAILNFAAAKEPMSVRLLAGPDVGTEDAALLELLRRGAVERHVRIDPDNLAASVEIRVPPEDWRCWVLGICRVRGTLRKRVMSGGLPVDLPVYNATVEVFEVDPLPILVSRLPDDVIERIRWIIIRPPIPPPPPPPDWSIVGFRRPAGPEREFRSSEHSLHGAGPTLEMTGEPTGVLSTTPDLQRLAQSTSTFQFRRVLLDHATLVRPILCHFFPRVVTMNQVATATTDECGHFETLFLRGCHNPDTPDLYFRAKQRFLPPPFPPFTIYSPTPIACYTYWDYVCGTEVQLYTSSPFAITGSPCPPVIAPLGTEGWVLVMAVGNHPLSRIYGTSVPLQSTSNSTNTGLTDGGAPWGGLVRLRLEFDNRLRDTLGVMYYRVGWHKGTNPADPFQDLTASEGAVGRHYAHMVGGSLIIDPYDLGPVTVGSTPNLFKIPPALPPIGQWSLPDVVEDTTNARFRTTLWAPAAQHGKYQLRLDLFDGAGTPVNIGPAGIKYLVPASTDLSGTILTEDAANLGLVTGNSFIMTLHIDNNECAASIGPPTLNGIPANDNCSVLEYTPATSGASVMMPYTASHPNGFATYSFSLYRGSNLLTPPSVSGLPVGGGSHSASDTVSNLLGGCVVAGFSENL